VACDAISRCGFLIRKTGAVLGSFGGNGRYAGNLHWIDAIAVDSHGNVYTGEAEDGKRIQKFVPMNAAAKAGAAKK